MLAIEHLLVAVAFSQVALLVSLQEVLIFLLLLATQQVLKGLLHGFLLGRHFVCHSLENVRREGNRLRC